jgi:hypothetical protein
METVSYDIRTSSQITATLHPTQTNYLINKILRKLISVDLSSIRVSSNQSFSSQWFIKLNWCPLSCFNFYYIFFNFYIVTGILNTRKIKHEIHCI